MPHPFRLPLLALLAGLPFTAAATAATAPHDAADQAMMAGMGRMKKSMADAPITGDPDHDFVAMMTPHHAGAIDMAKVELRYGKDPELRRLARGIIAAQERELVQMNAWTAAHPDG